MTKKFWILVGLAVAVLGTVIVIKTGNIGTEALWNLSGEGKWLLPLVLVAALLDSINPCAFSVLILTIAFLVSLGSARGKILTVGAFYIAGIFAAYFLIGIGLLQALHLFNTPHFMAKIAASLMIAAGFLSLVNHFFPSFPIKLKIPSISHRPMAALMERSTLPAAFLLGALVGVCEFPCTGGPYLLVLGLLHDQGTYLMGLGYLALYNLIFVAPLVVMLALGSDKGVLAKIEDWKKRETGRLRLWGGLLAILLGIFVFIF
ncbi:MAG: hypothetical protein FJY98_01870 [Candidatus Liptonbacteria bacterium]|nr:hypothetical protein [Candidatus Liptonbacteria bacterium]